MISDWPQISRIDRAEMDAMAAQGFQPACLFLPATSTVVGLLSSYTYMCTLVRSYMYCLFDPSEIPHHEGSSQADHKLASKATDETTVAHFQMEATQADRSSEFIINHLVNHSFAEVLTSDSFRIALERLDTIARHFFVSLTSSEAISCAKRSYRVIVPRMNGGQALLGFNDPSEAKLLFRYHRHSPSMIWPNEEFEDAVRECENIARETLISYFNDLAHALFPTRKDINFDTLMKMSTDALMESSGSQHLGDPCPFDMYWYHNRHDCRVPSNCEAHVDRGIMHLIIADTPGLEVLDAETGTWVGVGPSDFESQRYTKAVIICNSMLQDIADHSKLTACVHRVGKSFHPRLSFSFELRLGCESPQIVQQLRDFCCSNCRETMAGAQLTAGTLMHK